LARSARGRLVVGDRNGIHAGDRSAFAITGVMEALMALALLSANRRAVNTLLSAALIVVVVPAMGATFIAGLEGMAGDHSLVAFAVAWKSWWIKDAAGLLLLAPLWTLHSRKAIIENRFVRVWRQTLFIPARRRPS
jgi:integral membrane sensor domain MASE1